MSFQKTLQSVSNFLSTEADLLPLTGVGGFNDQPFLSLADQAVTRLVTDENDWKFNRAVMPMLVTCAGMQDSLFAGASIFVLTSSSMGFGIDLASNSAITVSGGFVTVKTLQQHRITVGQTAYMIGVSFTTGTASAYTSLFTDNGNSSSWSNGWVVTAVTSTSVTFAAVTGQNNGDVGGAPGITNFAFLTSGSMRQMNDASSPQGVRELTTYRELPVTSACAIPDKVCVLQDLQTGVLKIRFAACPSTPCWGVSLIYQVQAPVKQSMGDNWAPFPDHYSFVYIQAVRVEMYRYLKNAEMVQQEEETLKVYIAQAHGADDTELTEVHLRPEVPLMDGTDLGWF